MTNATLALLAVLAVCGGGLTVRGERLRGPAGALCLVVLLAGAAALAWRAGGTGDGARALGAVLAVVAAALGGGPVATAVLRAADPQRDELPRPPTAASPADVVGAEVKPAPRSMADPEVLRGGAWIGVLERTAIAGTVLAGWQEGLAVLIAVKGLGRFHEVKAPIAAERFIIGTLASGLWALGCVGAAVLLRT
jgi:hypothetical protein